jgi:hypothetical protein
LRKIIEWREKEHVSAARGMPPKEAEMAKKEPFGNRHHAPKEGEYE